MLITLNFSSEKPIKYAELPDMDWVKPIAELIWEWEKCDKIAFQSSGSSGKAKQMYWRKADLIKSAERTLDFLGIKKGAKTALALPVQFTGGKMALIRAIIGKQIVEIAKPSLDILQHVNYPLDLISISPAQAAHAPEKLAGIKKVLIGGGEIPNELESILKNSPTDIYHSYGMTETASNVAMRKLGENSFFTALDGVHFETDSKGALHIKDAVLGLSHETTDRVALIDKHHFHWISRLDRVINSGGVKIDVEKWLEKWRKHSAVTIRLAAMAHPVFGQQLILFVPTTLSRVDLQTILLKFSKNERPKRIFLLENIPKNADGKEKLLLNEREISELAAREIDVV